MRLKSVLVLILISPLLVAWLKPDADKIKAGNRHYKQGEYDQALESYNEVLINLPKSPYIHYNIGNAAYQKGDYKKAVEAYTESLFTDDEELEAKANYNIGNCKYRQGKLKENTNLQETVKLFREALDYYKRAIELNRENMNAKFNHEFVERKLKELLDRQEQEQNQQANENEGDRQERGESEGKSQDQQQQEGSEEEQRESDSESVQAEEQRDEEGAANQQQGEKKEITVEEALRLLDSLKDEEQHQLSQPRRGRFPEVFKDW